jgi:hypothetical protein
VCLGNRLVLILHYFSAWGTASDIECTEIANAPAYTGETVQDAIDWLYQNSGGSSGTLDAASVTNTPQGNIAATDVQAAINELDTEKAAISHTQSYTTITGLGNAATKNVGTTASDVSAGNHTHPAVTQSTPGRMSAPDKTKLDSLSTITLPVSGWYLMNYSIYSR